MEHAIQRHLEKVKSVMPNWETHLIGVFLYGSQNYNVHTKNSDVDTKAIYVPTLDELSFRGPDESRTLILDNGEHCELMSITHLVDNLFKQNVNFLEILWTPYYWVNPAWEVDWENMLNCKEELAHYDVKKAVLSISGQAIHTLKQCNLDGKKYGNSLRMLRFLEEYLHNKPYIQCIRLHDLSLMRQTILQYKTNEISVTQFEVDSLMKLFIQTRDDFAKDPAIKDSKVESYYRTLVKKIIMEGIMRYEEENF